MLKRSVLGSLLLFSSGCSYLFMKRPPEIGSQPAVPVECTSNLGAPLLDGVGAALMALTTAAVVANVASCNFNCGDGVGNAFGIASLAALTATFTASSVSGAWAVSRCDRLKLQSEACVNGFEPSCRTLIWDPRTARQKPAPPAGAKAPDEPANTCQKTDDCDGGICIDGYCRR